MERKRQDPQEGNHDEGKDEEPHGKEVKQRCLCHERIMGKKRRRKRRNEAMRGKAGPQTKKAKDHS